MQDELLLTEANYHFGDGKPTLQNCVVCFMSLLLKALRAYQGKIFVARLLRLGLFIICILKAESAALTAVGSAPYVVDSQIYARKGIGNSSGIKGLLVGQSDRR